MTWRIGALLLVVTCAACRGGGEGGARAAEGDGGAGGSGQGPAVRSGAGAVGTPPRALPPMEVTGMATDTIGLRSDGPVLQFVPDRISAVSGTRVLIRYENGGDLPHNFALFRSDDAVDRGVSAAYDADDTGYIPVAAAEDLIAYSPLVSPGAIAEIEFVVPPPGAYPFLCLFPGHAQMMLGTLTARE